MYVVGLGVVGQAHAHLMHKLGHEVYGWDIRKVDVDHILKIVQPDKAVNIVDVTFVCTPESAVPDIAKELYEVGFEFIVVRSTTVPGTLKNIMEEYDIHICHNPEFLREKYAISDILNENRIIIGACCEKHAEIVKRTYNKAHANIYITDVTTSEVVKITTNAYLATLISFWNEINKLTQHLKVDIYDVAKLVTLDHRVSKYGTSFFGKPFGGKCLPKDTQNLIDLYHSLDMNPDVLSAVVRFNKKLKGE